MIIVGRFINRWIDVFKGILFFYKKNIVIFLLRILFELDVILLSKLEIIM